MTKNNTADIAHVLAGGEPMFTHDDWARAYNNLYQQIELAWAEIQKLQLENAFLASAFQQMNEPPTKEILH